MSDCEFCSCVVSDKSVGSISEAENEDENDSGRQKKRKKKDKKQQKADNVYLKGQTSGFDIKV